MSTQAEAAKPKVRLASDFVVLLSHSDRFQGKTKAKQRYLKKKKEKRKKNKQQVKKPTDAKSNSDESESDDEEEEAAAMESVQTEAIPAPAPSKPPKKRRKIEAEDAMDVDTLEAPAEPSLSIDVDIPAGALPSFPLPVHPNLPSRSDLALQGLDKALGDAEFVEPSNILSFMPEGTDDSGTGLSEKTRKRLHDLSTLR